MPVANKTPGQLMRPEPCRAAYSGHLFGMAFAAYREKTLTWTGREGRQTELHEDRPAAAIDQVVSGIAYRLRVLEGGIIREKRVLHQETVSREAVHADPTLEVA